MKKCEQCPLKGFCQGETQKWVCEVKDKKPSFLKWMGDATHPLPAGESQPEYPSVMTQAKNLTISMIAAAKDGFKTVDKPEMQRRLEICHACEFFDKRQARCLKCGCYLEYKSRLRTEACPIGRW